MAKEFKREQKPRDNRSEDKKKVCSFCEAKNKPLYTDVVSLRRYTSSRGKIVPKQRSGVCSKHQRSLAREIKRARHLALLPFSLSV
jgi:small subunit ribosomal protein S18